MEGTVSLGVCTAFSIGWIMQPYPNWKEYTSYLDPLTCIAIALLFIVSPFKILRNSLSDLTDACPPKEIMDRVSGLAKFCCEKHGLAAVEWLRLRKSGRRLYMDVRFETQQDYNIKTIDKIRHDIKSDLKDKLPELDVLLEFAVKNAAVSGTLNSSKTDCAKNTKAIEDALKYTYPR